MCENRSDLPKHPRAELAHCYVICKMLHWPVIVLVEYSMVISL